MNKKTKNKSLSLIKAMRCTIPMITKTFPLTIISAVILTMLMGSSLALSTPINQHLYDKLADLVFMVENGVNNWNHALHVVFIGVAWVAGITLIRQVLNGVQNLFLYQYMQPKINGYLHTVVQAKIEKLPAQWFEDKDKLDDLEKASQGASGATNLLTVLIQLLFFHIAFFFVMGGYLLQLQPVFLIVFVFVFTPVAFSQIIEARIFAKMEDVSTPVSRQNAHYEACLVSKSKIKEMRLFGTFHFFKNLYMETLRLLSHKEWDVQKKITTISLGLNIVKGLGWISVIALLFNTLIKGDITVGAFAAVFATIDTLFGQIEAVFMRVKNGVTPQLGRIHNFINLLEIPEHHSKNDIPDFDQGILATDVYFSYPKTDKYVVRGVTLNIQPCETVAIVGENGSGKTTLVKLLIGLYTPESGTILIGGCDVRTTAERALFSETSGVFQNYNMYVFSLRENVKLSDYSSVEDVSTALKSADVNFDEITTFSHGLDTILSREFDGIDLSGGQWQRIAMARGLYRKHVYIVLDEPTAAIDPIEETKMYKRFAEFSKNKTTILVTHRLGSARIADRIIVMENGNIIENGTHEELQASNGKYAQMWIAQAGGYL
jgi:ATP-binding cassette subfamily B protein